MSYIIYLWVYAIWYIYIYIYIYQIAYNYLLVLIFMWIVNLYSYSKFIRVYNV